MSLRALVHATCVALAFLPTMGALPASADDDGPPRPRDAAGRPAATVLRAAELPPRQRRELVYLVGGLGSQAGDTTWEALSARLYADPRYEVRRFGASAEHPYDSVGSLDRSAANLTGEVRRLAPGYSAVHIVTHSMGGAVVDRAFAQGLSAADGVRTYVALAAPHSGATAAKVAQTALAVAGDQGREIRAALSPVHDIDSPAVRDLARLRPSAAPPGIARLDLRLTTDVLVAGRDAATPGIDSRILFPSSAQSIEGHGGILTDPRALDLVTATIATGRPPVDERGALLRRATDFWADKVDELALLLLLALAAGAITSAFALRAAQLLKVASRPITHRLLVDARR